MELIQQLKEDGIAKGLCQLWQNKLTEGVSVKRLARLYVRGIDFCIKNDYPTLDFIRDNFKGKCEPYGVFVDEPALELRDIPDVVLNGNCKGTLTYGGFSVCRAFIRHDSEIKIQIFGHANIAIDVYDNAVLDLITFGSKAKVSVKTHGNSTIRHKGYGVLIL